MTGSATLLPGNVGFLDDGRVLCLPRARGDSRYPYGRDGFLLWVHASGYMCANRGSYFPFLPAQEGHEPRIAFHAGRRKSSDNYTPISLLPVPYHAESETEVRERYTVLGHDAAYFVMESDDLVSTVRVFLDQADPSDVRIAFSILLLNCGKQVADLHTSAYFDPFCRHQFAESCEDRWFKRIESRPSPAQTSSSEEQQAMAPFVVAVNEDISRFRSVTNWMLVRRAITFNGRSSGRPLAAQVCTSRNAYMGSVRQGLAQASCLRRGRFESDAPLTVFNDNAIVGDMNLLHLDAGASLRLDYVLSLPRDSAAMEAGVAEAVDTQEIDAVIARRRESLATAAHDLDLRVQGCTLEGVGTDTLNHFFPYLRRQVAICAETHGFMQPAPNSLIGIRDVFQAIEGHLFDQPEAAKRKMREALGYVLVDGRCPRQYSLPRNDQPGPADLREFVDQGVWVISTLYTYVITTGDLAFLDETLGYHRIKPGSETSLEPAGERDTVLEHLIRIMEYLLRQRDPDTELIRALYGDWNDALDGLGTTSDSGTNFGTGVSVMASLQVYRNCAEMVELLTRANSDRHADARSKYTHAREAIGKALCRHAVVRDKQESRIVHGWGDKRSYYVGSFSDSDGESRDGLTSNAFWVMCSMLERDPELRVPILSAMRRLDSRFGMRTFTPGFAPDAPGVGRIPKLPVGTAENGATYVHATAFGIMALFLMNEPRLAWEQIHKVLPFSPHQENLSHSPFVIPNSYAYNRELGLTGQNMNDWQTGSANVLLKALVWYVCGFRPEWDGLRVAPASWCPLTRFEYCGRYRGRRVRIVYRKSDVPQRQFHLGERRLTPQPDEATTVPSVLLPESDLSPDDENVITISDPE